MDNICAIIWDYDCTLANTWHKNLIVTRKIVTKVSGQDASQIRALSTAERYQYTLLGSMNWRDFYRQECGLSQEQTEQAGGMWTEFQLSDDTPIQVFEGIPDVIARLSDLPHGIVSQNSRQTIIATLCAQQLRPYFSCIVGYEEVAFEKQKPAPDGLLLCMEHLCNAQPRQAGIVCYIGDHEVDAACAYAANQRLQSQNSGLRVVSIAAFYGCQGDASSWSIKPDYTVRAPQQIPEVILGL